MLDGRLAERLRTMQADGLTLDAMVDSLRVDGIDKSRETLRRWLKALDAESTPEAVA